MISIKNVMLPNKPLSNFKLEVSSFRGAFLLDTLPRKPNKKECDIVNFDKSGGPGTHWVAWYKNGKTKIAWYKNGKTKIHFDSYGVQPPIEVVEYLGSPIHYNTINFNQWGKYFAVICVYTFSKSSTWVQSVLNNFF